MRHRRWVVVAVAAGIVAVVAVVWALRARTAPKQPAGGSAARVVPVTVATASRRDVPIYLEGLGSVAAFRSVTIRTQVDGRLESVLFKEGQLVRQGQVLAKIDPRPFQAQLHQMEGALARDQAQLENARLNVARDRELVAKKLVAQQQLDADTAAAGQLEGAVRMDQAAIETARLNLDYARIVSPIDGVAGIRFVDAGNVVHPADQNGIVVVAQMDPVAVLFTLPQDMLPAVSEQLAQGPLPVDAYSRDGSTLLGSGQLAAVDNQINQATATIRLKAIMPNPRRVLWPNQFVNARMRLETRRGALVIPGTAVQRGPNGAFVYVVGGDDTVAQRPVATVSAQGDLTLVASGLSEGERVVVDGQNQLRPGAKVAPRLQGQRDGNGPQRAPQDASRTQGRDGAAPVASDGSDAGRPAGGAR